VQLVNASGDLSTLRRQVCCMVRSIHPQCVFFKHIVYTRSGSGMVHGAPSSQQRRGANHTSTTCVTVGVRSNGTGNPDPDQPNTSKPKLMGSVPQPGRLLTRGVRNLPGGRWKMCGSHACNGFAFVVRA